MSNMMSQQTMPEDEADPHVVTEEGAEPQEGEPASPEEQKQYEDTMNVIFDQMLYPNGKTNEAIINRLKQGNPMDALASTTAIIVVKVEADAVNEGVELGPDVLLQVGKSTLEELVTIAETAKIHEFSDDEIKGAVMRAMDSYRELKGDAIDQKAAQQDWQQLLAADRAMGQPKQGPAAMAPVQKKEMTNG